MRGARTSSSRKRLPSALRLFQCVRKTRALALERVIAEPIHRSPRGMVALVDVLVGDVAPAAVLVLPGQHELDAGADQGVVLAGAEGLQRVEEFAGGLRVVDLDAGGEIFYEERVLGRQPWGLGPPGAG